jgi:hypothetical protein
VDFKASPVVTYVLPSEVVAEVLRKAHRAWLAAAARAGKTVKNWNSRWVKRAYAFPVRGYPDGWLDAWAEKWDLIVGEVKEAAQGSVP